MKSGNGIGGTGGTASGADAEGAFPDDWDVRRYRHHAAFVPALGAPVVTLLAPRPGERILDLCCGDGTLTESLIAAGAEVVGIDASADMVAAARARGIDARAIDAAALPFAAEFDAVFSNAALHWMTAADAVLAGVGRALRPGGRFVGEFGGAGNVAAIVTALAAVLARRGVDFAEISPWYFPTVDAYRARLEAHGFGVDTIESIPRPTPLPGAMEDWLETLAAPAFRVLPERERAAARDEAIALLRPALRDERGRWTADYVRLRFAARLATPPTGTDNR